MSRLWSSGFELNSTADNVEFTGHNNTLPVIQSTIVHGGSYALQARDTGSATSLFYRFAGAGQGSTVTYYRFYLCVAALPNSADTVFNSADDDLGNDALNIMLTTAGTLQLRDNGTQIGSSSPVLSLNTWHRIEFKSDMTVPASTICEARLNGVTFTSGTVDYSLHSKPGQIEFGSLSGVIANLYFDDIAINNSAGGFQNSWPGDGKIIHLHPNGAGDVTNWARGGTDSGTNYGQVDEVTPNDATDYVRAKTGITDLYQITDSGLTAGNAINVVSAGVRFAGEGASANSGFQVYIQDSHGISASGALTPSSTTWKTNADAAPFTYPVTIYQDSAGNPLTSAAIDTMQIGPSMGSVNTNFTDVSTMWLLVDYTPLAQPTMFGGSVPSTSFRHLDSVVGY